TMLLSPERVYCSSHTHVLIFGTHSTSWSQQNMPRFCGNALKGSTNVHVAPASGEQVANQLPVTNTSVRDMATLGSATVPVSRPVAGHAAASARPRTDRAPPQAGYGGGHDRDRGAQRGYPPLRLAGAAVRAGLEQVLDPARVDEGRDRGHHRQRGEHRRRP